MRMTIKPSDVLRSKIIDPGWYRSKITKAQDAPAKKDGSMNAEVNFEIVSNPDGTPTPFAKIPITNYFNEKFPHFSIEFIEAMGGQTSEEHNVDFEIGPQLVGKFVDIQVKNNPSETGSRVYNNIEHFRSAQKLSAGAVPAA